MNVAVDLNGQPPIQVFAKLSDRPEIVIRSIDLGVEQRVRTYEELDTFCEPGSEFALAKAALALAGFLPRFHASGGFARWSEQLESLAAASKSRCCGRCPKGSGLGTSSILAATLLAALGELCGLNWDRNVLFSRTLALEQMLTTGGGWQDQAGAMFRGIKLIETEPGLTQKPACAGSRTNSSTPTTRTARSCSTTRASRAWPRTSCQEIVRGIFLNSPAHLRTIAGNRR